MDYLSLFLQAENFSDFLNRADFAQEIQTKDREMFLEYQETKQEVADLLDLHVNTVYRLFQKKIVPAFKLGGSWRIYKKDLIDFIEKRPG